jgi:hypothetical protein
MSADAKLALAGVVATFANLWHSLRQSSSASLDLDHKRHGSVAAHVPSQVDPFGGIIQERESLIMILYERARVLVH